VVCSWPRLRVEGFVTRGISTKKSSYQQQRLLLFTATASLSEPLIELGGKILAKASERTNRASCGALLLVLPATPRLAASWPENGFIRTS